MLPWSGIIYRVAGIPDVPASVYFSDFAMMVGSLFCLCVLGAAASSGDIRAAANRLEAAGPVSRAALRDAELDILIQSGEKSAAEFAPKDGCVKVRGGGGGGGGFRIGS